MRITVSAPSKVILFGEHAAVYSKPALAASLNLRTYMKIHSGEDAGGEVIHVQFPDIKVNREWKLSSVRTRILKKRPNQFDEVDEAFVASIVDFIKEEEKQLKRDALTCFFYLLAAIFKPEEAQGLKVQVESEIPIGAGLGSSAALSVSLAAGLLTLKNIELLNKAGNNAPTAVDRERINDLSLLAEKILHGNPSGIDNTTSVYGGMVAFHKGQLGHFPRLRIVLMDSKISRSTKELVNNVKQKALNSPEKTGAILTRIGEITEKMTDLMENRFDGEEDLYRIIDEAVEANHRLLNDLQVSHPKLEEIVRIAGDHGFKAKLTGAGGGGFAFAVIKPGKDISDLIKELQTGGYDCFQSEIGVPGVSVQKEQ